MDDIVRSLHDEGFPASYIAAFTGLDEAAVHRRLVALDLEAAARTASSGAVLRSFDALFRRAQH